jgi:iron(III) transport system permease protein
VDRGAWGAAIARVAAAVALGAIVGGPLLRLFVELDGAALGALLDPLELRAARNTVAVVAGTTTLSLTAGVALGVLLARTDLPHPERLRTWLVVPYVLPPYVTALGWLLLLNPATGWLYRGLDPYSLAGMIAVLAVEHTPLVLLATLDALGRMDGSLEEQARIAGAGPLGTLRRVTLPLVAPAILAAASFVASSSAAAFGVPYLLSTGASDPTFVLTTRIAQALDLDPAAGRPRAVALSLVLLAVGVVVPGLAGWWLRGRSTTTVRGKVVRPSVLPLGGLRWPAFAVVCAVIAATTALPLGAIALASVRPNLGSDGFTGTHYARLVTGPAAGVFARSAVTAAAAAAAAVGVGALVAWREVRAGDRALGAVARLPYAVPGTVLALGTVAGVLGSDPADRARAGDVRAAPRRHRRVPGARVGAQVPRAAGRDGGAPRSARSTRRSRRPGGWRARARGPWGGGSSPPSWRRASRRRSRWCSCRRSRR